MIGVYSITNIKNNKIYIGESLDIDKRWIRHKEDLLQNKHCNYFLQNDFNALGKKFFKFNILQEINPENVSITQAKLLMLEDAYIKYYTSIGRELYNIENTLNKILNGDKRLQVSSEISNEVVISNFLKYKYVLDNKNNKFILKERDTLENLILNNSSIRSKQKAKQVANDIFEKLKTENLFEKYTYSITFDLYMHHKNSKRTITEITELGKQYILNNFNFDSYLLRFSYQNKNENIIKIRKQIKNQGEINKKDKNKIQDVYKTLKEENIIPSEYKYNDFRNILINMNLIIIDKNRNTCATDFSINNKFFIAYLYNASKEKFQYYISENGINFIKNNINKTKIIE